jgi:hypothetical protein
MEVNDQFQVQATFIMWKEPWCPMILFLLLQSHDLGVGYGPSMPKTGLV